MNTQTIKMAATRALSMGALKIRKNGPTILTTVGIVGGIASTVLASRATLKVEDKIEAIQNNLESVNENQTLVTRDNEPVYTPQDLAKQKLGVYVKGSFQIARLYAPAVSVGLMSIGCIVSAHGIMQRRNAALMVAYTALDKGFTEYRKRVEDAFGEDKERELRYGITTEEIHNTEKGIVEAVSSPDPRAVDIYARLFDEVNPNWSKSPDQNLQFLTANQNYCNDLLRSRGHLFLNDVYDMLGMERSAIGAVCGWLYEKGDGDHFVDFGIFNSDKEVVREFVNGRERSIMLDFNVDGVIYKFI